MRYVMFGLEFQSQWSRSQYRYICFWIQRHRFGSYRHQTQVSTIYTTRDIILNALCHVWPWISRSYVTILEYKYFLISRHRFSTYRHQTQVTTIYTTRDIILNVLCHVWPWISRSKVKVTTMSFIFWIPWHLSVSRRRLIPRNSWSR